MKLRKFFIELIESRRGAFRSAIKLFFISSIPSIILMISYCILFFYKKYPEYLRNFVGYFRDIVINNHDIFKVGIQILIGLMSVIAITGLYCLNSSIKPKDRDKVRTGIIKIVRIIMIFIIFFLFLGFFRHPLIDLIIFVSLSLLLTTTVYYIGYLFEVFKKKN